MKEKPHEKRNENVVEGLEKGLERLMSILKSKLQLGTDRLVTIAITGLPNVGKSELTKRLIEKAVKEGIRPCTSSVNKGSRKENLELLRSLLSDNEVQYYIINDPGGINLREKIEEHYEMPVDILVYVNNPRLYTIPPVLQQFLPKQDLVIINRDSTLKEPPR